VREETAIERKQEKRDIKRRTKQNHQVPQIDFGARIQGTIEGQDEQTHQRTDDQCQHQGSEMGEESASQPTASRQRVGQGKAQSTTLQFTGNGVVRDHDTEERDDETHDESTVQDLVALHQLLKPPTCRS